VKKIREGSGDQSRADNAALRINLPQDKDESNAASANSVLNEQIRLDSWQLIQSNYEIYLLIIFYLDVNTHLISHVTALAESGSAPTSSS